jgi:apolipoprotein N-acyltransferase
VTEAAAPAAVTDRREAPPDPALPETPQTGDGARRRRRLQVLGAVLSGALLALAFPSTDWGPLALVALVPLFLAWRDEGVIRSALLGLVAGVVFFAWLLAWTWYFGAVAMGPLVLVLAAYWAATGATVAALRRLGIRSPWVTAAAWVVFEAIRDRWPLHGFAWGEVGVALHDLPVARALASWGGVPLVSFLVVAWSALLADAIVDGRHRQRRPLAWAAAGLVGVVLVAAVGDWTRYSPRDLRPLRFALLQGNDQNRRLTQREIDDEYLTKRHLALARTLRGRYDLIVFPESALETDPETDLSLRRKIQAIARKHGSAVLINVVEEGTRGREYNTNRLYDARGRLVGSYRKQHLVPFGEYVPWRDQLTFISELQQIPHDFTPGTRDAVWSVDGAKVGSVICFESAFAPLVRSTVRAGANVVVVSTNNRSYRRSANSAQHVALSQMRAAETARPVLHASISGITAVIDASGDVERTTHLFRNTVVTGSVTPTEGETPYVRFGDWVVWLSLLVLGGTVVAGVARRRLRP